LKFDTMLILSSVPPGRVFGLDAQTVVQILLHSIIFITLSFVIAKLLYNPVLDYIKNRNAKISGEMGRANADMAQATELQQQYEQKMKVIEEEKTEIIETARKTAMENGRVIMVNAKKEADDLLHRAKAEIDKERAQVQEEVRLHIIHVSSSMTDRFLVRGADVNSHGQLYDETLAKEEEFNWLSHS